MNDAIRRLIELERRQLDTARAQFDIRNKLTKASQDVHNHWYNTYPTEPRDQSTAPGTNYPWAMKRVWVTLDWDTSVVFDPYKGHKDPSTSFDVYAWPSGHRILCDWSNASPQVPYNGKQWTGNVTTETRYGFKSGWLTNEIAVKFQASWNITTQSFTLDLTNYVLSRPQQITRYWWDIPTNSWKTSSTTSTAATWSFGLESGLLTVPYDPINPQFIGTGSLSASTKMVVRFSNPQITDYWSSGAKPDGTTYPLAPVFPAVPDRKYALWAGDPDPEDTTPYVRETLCNVTVEWEN